MDEHWIKDVLWGEIYLNFQEVFKTDDIGFSCLVCGLLLGFENEARRQGMSILAIFTIWTFPEPTKFL